MSFMNKMMIRSIRALYPVVGQAVVRDQILKGCYNDMKKDAKKHKDSTTESLSKRYLKEPEFMKLCDDMQIDSSAILYMAEQALTDSKESK